jgi:toxin ParE1/3/4
VTKPLLFEEEASREMDGAAVWYDEQRAGLGQRFLDAVAATLERIVIFPAAGARVPRVSPDLAVRQAPVKRFPYRIIYLEAQGAIRVLAVAHDRRGPDYWLDVSLRSR